MNEEDTTPLQLAITKRTIKTFKFGWDIENFSSIPRHKDYDDEFKPQQSMIMFPGCCSFRFSAVSKGKKIQSINKKMLMSNDSASLSDRWGHLTGKHDAHIVKYKQYLLDPKGGQRFVREEDFDTDFLVDREESVLDFLDHDTLKYRLEIELIILSTECKGQPKSLDYPRNLGENMGQLLGTEHLSDLTIITADDEPIKVHKLILASRSPVFKAMFDSGLEESKTNVLKRDDIDTKTMKVFLRYLYTDEMKFEESTSVELITTVFKLADQYQIPRLKHLCEVQMAANYNTDSIFEILQLARTYDAKYLKKCGLEYIKANKSTLASDPDILSKMAKSKELGLEILAALASD